MQWKTLIFAAMMVVAAHARGELIFNVTLDYDQERNHYFTKEVFNELARHVADRIGRPVKLVMTQNAERVGERIRAASYDVLLAPAQLIGVAMRHGYTPVAKMEEDTRLMLLARTSANVSDLQQARSKRIALPHRESLVSYLIRGELNAMGFTPSSYFGHVMHLNQYGAVLYALDIGQADVAAVKQSVAQDWLSKRNDTKVIHSFTQVPQAGVAVSDELGDALKERIKHTFTNLPPDMVAKLTKVGFGAFDPADRVDFEYVSTRGYYTPEILPGATIVTAEQVKQLMAQGVPLFDVRPPSHYREAHIPGAVNVPYQSNSPKEPDADDSVDVFDLSKLPKDKNAPMIFQCNGAECWYSYKASRYAIKRGYKKVYWFRTGLPAWKASGYPLERGA